MVRFCNISIALGLVFLFLGCSTVENAKTLAVATTGDQETQERLEENPNLILGELGSQYAMKVFEPDPNLNFLITQITPDSDVDYQIVVVAPYSEDEIIELSQ